MAIIGIKIIMAIIVVLTVIFVMAVNCICHYGRNINALLEILSIIGSKACIACHVYNGFPS